MQKVIKVLNFVHILIVIDCVYILLKFKVSRKSKRTGYQIGHVITGKAY